MSTETTQAALAAPERLPGETDHAYDARLRDANAALPADRQGGGHGHAHAVEEAARRDTSASLGEAESST